MRYLIVSALTALCVAPFAMKADTLYTSSADFLAALGPSVQVENFSSGFSDGEDIAGGFSANGITYGPFSLTQGATSLDIIGTRYNSFSGHSLGADHTAAYGANDSFFFGGEGATLTFAVPVTAVGLFFNVAPNTGNYEVHANGDTASTGSGSYDTGTFVFAGIISTTPFSSATFDSTDSTGSYNIPEIVTSTLPEPTAFIPLGAALALLPLLRRRFTL